jgi:ribosomal protein S12 methylthiotransferase
LKDKISVITLGCSKNTVDSERLLKQLQLNDFNLVDSPENANTVIINTCGFIDAAKEESINAIINAVSLKQNGIINKVIVTGCLSERYKDDLKKEIPEVDSFFGTEKYEGILKELGGDLKYELLGERLLTAPSHTAYLKISEGCDNPCSFCAIPLMRGLHKSKTVEELVAEAEALAKLGTKELIIIGQDTTDYGKDIYGRRNLAELLRKLSLINGIKWIRLMYAYPSHFPDDLIDEIADNPKICKYIDIPLQHISDKILKSMRRGITRKRTIELLNTLKERIPGLVLRTTIITGYPGETKKEFEELCGFIKEFKFDRLGVFTYSIEENTPAFVLGDKISHKEKEKRKEILMEIQQEISLNLNSRLPGTKLEVLIDRKEGGFFVGRSFREAPEVDGEILINGTDNRVNIGSFYCAEVFDFNEYDLFANIINS